MTTGLLLLSGGQGSRMGRPKHSLAHPGGGSWGGYLVRAFTAVCPGGPVQVLGEPLPEWPDLPRLDDPREGPAVALRLWCRTPVTEASRWWVVACDQVRWTPERLRSWLDRTAAADSGADHWILARHDDRVQPLGGVLASALRPRLATLGDRSLLALVDQVPHVILDAEGEEWLDVDTPADRCRFEGEGGRTR